MIRVEFFKLLPDEVEKHGPDGALILALLRYATERDDGRHGRLTIGGKVYWRASYAEIAASTRLGYSTVRRVTSKLETAGVVEVLATYGGDDRTRIYRPLTSQLSIPAGSDHSFVDSDSQPVDSSSQPVDFDSQPVDFDSCTTPIEKKRRRERSESAAPSADHAPTDLLAASLPGEANSEQQPSSGPVEAKSPNGVVAKKKARTGADKIPLPAGWCPSPEKLLTLAAKYPTLDVGEQLEAFVEKAERDGWVYASWDAAFASFLRTGGVYGTNGRQNGQPPNANGNNHSQKVAATDLATQEALELLNRSNQPAINGATQKELR
jgi:hypothetical protein